ncbi:MAG: S9 family peptidase, partial [Brevundimonas sp.]|nr:S9 family peptidase [Brevundimonas sp.]
MIRNAALAALLASTALCTSAMAQTPTPPNPPLAEGAFATSDATDPYVWLEEVEGERAMAWVNAHNEHSLGVLRG